MSELRVEPYSLLLFIDETGHEQLSDPKYPVFGIGGCAVMGSEYDQIIRKPWKKLKADYFGGPDVSLHAASLRDITTEQMEALASFFTTQPFSRFAAIMKITTSVFGEITPYQLISGTVIKRIEKILSCYPFRSLTLIFESSDRTDILSAHHFGSLGVQVDGKEMPVNKFRMSKSTRESGLELADFIIHTSGSQVRDRIAGKRHWRKDFDCIFHNIDQRLVSYIEIDSAKKNE